jgi:hypothetical protein
MPLADEAFISDHRTGFSGATSNKKVIIKEWMKRKSIIYS